MSRPYRQSLRQIILISFWLTWCLGGTRGSSVYWIRQVWQLLKIRLKHGQEFPCRQECHTLWWVLPHHSGLRIELLSDSSHSFSRYSVPRKLSWVSPPFLIYYTFYNGSLDLFFVNTALGRTNVLKIHFGLLSMTISYVALQWPGLANSDTTLLTLEDQDQLIVLSLLRGYQLQETAWSDFSVIWVLWLGSEMCWRSIIWTESLCIIFRGSDLNLI